MPLLFFRQILVNRSTDTGCRLDASCASAARYGAKVLRIKDLLKLIQTLLCGLDCVF